MAFLKSGATASSDRRAAGEKIAERTAARMKPMAARESEGFTN